MKLAQVSISKLIVVVVFVALNFAAARALFAFNSEILIGIALMGIVLQFGLLKLLESHRRGRVFWVGLVLCSLTAMGSFVWAMLFPEILEIRWGTLIRTPGSPLYTVWYGYAEFVSERLIARILDNPRIKSALHCDSVLGSASIVVIRAVLWFLPQLLIAMVGGLLTRVIGSRLGRIPSGHFHPQVSAIVPSQPM